MVVRRYVNTPYINHGTTQHLYLDMIILSTQFPLESLCLHRLLPFSKDEIVLSCQAGNAGLVVYPLTADTLLQLQREALPFESHLIVSWPAWVAPSIGWEH